MLTTLPYSTAWIIGAVEQRKIAGPGIVEKRIDEGMYVISCAAGRVTVKVSSGSLSEGDMVSVAQRGNELVLQKLAFQAGNSQPAKDAVDVDGATYPATLKRIVDTVVDQLKKRIIDKSTLDQLQRILAAVSKKPEAFDKETQKAVSGLKTMVASMTSGGPDISKVASEITDRIIALAEKLGQKLKSAGGAIDIVLKPEAGLKEGYYKFDTLKSACSWLVENKERNADIPWQKLSATFKDGPAVLKVYESAIGDLRASLVSPDKVEADIEHFVQSSLKADIWKNISISALVNLLFDRKEIPVERLLQIDKLLSAYDCLRPPSLPRAPRDGLPSENADAGVKPFSPGSLETAFGQWLAIALDKDSPVEALAARSPAPGQPRLIDLLWQIDASRQNAGVVSEQLTKDEAVALCRSTVVDTQRPESVIIDLFRRLGLDLESALSKSRAAEAPDSREQNLKEMLLSLQNAIEAPVRITETPGANKAPPDLSAALQDIAEDCKALAQSIKNNPNTVAPAQSPQAEDTIKEFSSQIQSISKETFTILDNAENAVIRLMFGEPTAQTASKTSEVINPYLQNKIDTQALSAKEIFLHSVLAVIQQAIGAGPARVAGATAEIPAAIAALQKDLAATLQKLFPQSPEGRSQIRRILDMLKPFLETAARLNVTARSQADALPAAAEKLIQGLRQLADELAIQGDREGAFAIGITFRANSSMAETASAVQSRLTKTFDQLEKLAQDLFRGLAKFPDAIASSTGNNLGPDKQAQLSSILADKTTQVNSLIKRLIEQIQAFKSGIPVLAQTMQSRLEQLALNFSQQSTTGIPENVGGASLQSSMPATLSQNPVNEAENILDAMINDIDRQMQGVLNKSSLEKSFLTVPNRQSNSISFTTSIRGSENLVEDGIAPLMHIIRQCSNDLKELVKNTFSKLSQPIFNLPGQENETDRLVREFSDRSASIVSRARQQIQDLALQQTKYSARPTDPAQSPKETGGCIQDPANSAALQLAAKVKNFADLLQNMTKQTAGGEEQLPKETAARAAGRTKQADIELLTKNIIKQLDGFTTSREAGPVSRDVVRQLEDLASQAAKLAEKLPQDVANGGRGQLDTLKHQVEQVLTRVESMQVLAKQVSFSDGQQQVMSLPMKIGDQWTDVVIKFMKKRQLEKEPSNKKISVVIHVAPSLLGEVTVFMDYNGIKDFSMRMEFEKASGRAWFENNQTEFSKAFGKFGFSSFKIDMKEHRRKNLADPVSQTTIPSTGTIDIKA